MSAVYSLYTSQAVYHSSSPSLIPEEAVCINNQIAVNSIACSPLVIDVSQGQTLSPATIVNGFICLSFVIFTMIRINVTLPKVCLPFTTVILRWKLLALIPISKTFCSTHIFIAVLSQWKTSCLRFMEENRTLQI
jgi:hypothetical protein